MCGFVQSNGCETHRTVREFTLACTEVQPSQCRSSLGSVRCRIVIQQSAVPRG